MEDEDRPLVIAQRRRNARSSSSRTRDGAWRRRRWRRRTRQVRRSAQGAARPPTVRPAAVEDHPIRPGIEPIRVAQVGQVAPDLDEGRLERIAGGIAIAEDPQGDRVEAVAHLRRRPGRKASRSPLLRPFDEGPIHHGLRRIGISADIYEAWCRHGPVRFDPGGTAASFDAGSSHRVGRPHAMTTLLDLLEGAVARYGDRDALGSGRRRHAPTQWSFRELDRRSRIAAWRLRALGLEPGDRILTWSPSMPELAAAYYGAMRARLVLVPLDLRMSAEAVEGIVRASGARHLILGTGRDAPDPREAGLEPSRPRPWTRSPPSPTRTTRSSRRTGRRARPPGAPTRRRGLRARLHVRHHGHAQGRDAHPRQRRGLDRVVPPDRPADGAPDRVAAAAVAPARAGGRAVLRARCRRGHPVRAQPQPARHLRCAAGPSGHVDGRRPPGARPVLERHRARGREARPDAAFDRLRAIARHLPWPPAAAVRSVHAQLGGRFRLFLSSGAFLPPALQQAGRTSA